ncbi:MAG: hypothetical protein GXO86_10915 [Chlorobi bacterium]|nr:hypothetical protein [Chlorobiota bacterium]
MSKRVIETPGMVTKKERVAVVEHETNCNYLILESLSPFPGYHGTTVPDSLEPDSLFAVTRLMHNDERIIRSVQAVKKQTVINFDGAPGTLDIQHQPAHFIRFKFVKYGDMGQLLKLFKENGIEFKRRKKLHPYESIIKVRKFFRMKEMSKDIFADLDDECMFYLKLPAMLRWNTFEKITTNIKYNVDDKNFDAALTNVYGKEGIIDFVRIFDREATESKLRHIHKKYLEAVSKL